MIAKFLQTLTATIALASCTFASPLALFRRTLVLDSVDPSQREIIIGQNPSGAYVTYSFDSTKTNLIVSYGDVPGQTYKTIHLFIGISKPTTHTPGQFPYTSENGYCTIAGGAQTATCTIPINLITTDPCAGTTFYIASHAAHTSETNPTSDGETSWGNGECITINPQTGKCAPWALYSTFKFVCKEPEVEPPLPPVVCELGTAFGYPTSGEYTLGFLNTIGPAERWGWFFTVPTTSLNGGGTVSGNVHVGAGGNNLNNGVVTGTFTVQKSGSSVLVSYHLVGKYDLMEVHVYASCTPPTKVAPGSFQYKQSLPSTNPADQQYTVTVPTSALSCLSDPSKSVYFILHATVGETVNAGTVCPVKAV